MFAICGPGKYVENENTRLSDEFQFYDSNRFACIIWMQVGFEIEI